jgi:multidrug efflux system membrane fusion protein
MAVHEAIRSADTVPSRLTSGQHRYGRWWLYGGIALVVALLAWFILPGLFAPAKKPPPPPPVKVGTATRQDVTVTRSTIGTVVSPATVQVTAQVGGKLLAANFHEGDIVRKGALLFQIDPAPYQAALAQAQGQLEKDQATLVNDRIDLGRYQTLAQQNAISNQQMVTQAAKVKADDGIIVSDQANVQSARINLGYTRIVSPIDGKTGVLFIQPGNIITAGAATAQPLVTITQVQPIKVSFMLPQNLLADIQDQVSQKRMQVAVPMAGVAGGSEHAPVDFVSNVVSGASGTIELRADFPNDDMRLVPGQTVTVSAAIGHIPGALVVPRDAVNQGPDSSFVLVVGKDGKAMSKPVKLLNDDGTLDAIQGDVHPGDKVVTDGQLRVISGQAVQIAGGKPAPKP